MSLYLISLDYLCANKREYGVKTNKNHYYAKMCVASFFFT